MNVLVPEMESDALCVLAAYVTTVLDGVRAVSKITGAQADSKKCVFESLPQSLKEIVKVPSISKAIRTYQKNESESYDKKVELITDVLIGCFNKSTFSARS